MAVRRFLLFCFFFFFFFPAQSSKKLVTRLPGFDGPLPFYLETGYVEVNETNGQQLFYYFVQSEGDPARDPLLLWVTGGPGCTGLSGLVYQIGPFSIDAQGYTGGLPRLLYRPQAWTKDPSRLMRKGMQEDCPDLSTGHMLGLRKFLQMTNIIFVDSPVGTGFSYANTDDALQTSDTKAWFLEHQQFLTNPFYVAGDSYGGMIIPTLTLEIHKRKESSEGYLLNLKGYIAGNPVTDRRIDANGRIPFLHGMGLISDELYELAKVSCSGEYHDPANVQCASSVQAIEDCTKDICRRQILEPNCEEPMVSSPSWNVDNTTGTSRVMVEMDNSIPIHFDCRVATYVLSRIWATDATVQECLGVRKGTITTWKRCDHNLPYTYDIASTVEYHFKLANKGYRAMIYSGDHDSHISPVGTQAWIKSLNLSIVDDWRPWYVGGQVAGFTRSYSSNLTYVTVKGAGHTAPEYKPKECLAMLARWISGNPL